MEKVSIILVTSYFVLMSMIGFATMRSDKQRAIKKGWRIPERTLLLIAFAGGGIGSFLGMYTFRHKTKHIKFVVLIPLSVILYFILGCLIIYLK